LGWIPIFAIAVAVIMVGGFLIYQVGRSADPGVVPASETSVDAEQRTGGIAFETSSVSGYWKITDHQWSGDRVTATLSIVVDDGTLTYMFYAFGVNDSVDLRPVGGAADSLEYGTIRAGATETTGTVTFTTQRQPIMLVLADGRGNQLSALTIEG
jgi:hypothetical protein